MTDVIKALCDNLSKSPSVVYPQDVLEYLPAIEAENAKLKAGAERMFQANVEKNNEIVGLLADNAKLRELLVEVLHELDKVEENVSHGWFWEAARELGVEVDE